MKFIASVSVALFAAVSTASASPVERSAQDVWAPKVTFPTAGAEFVVGKSYTFLWSVDCLLLSEKSADVDAAGTHPMLPLRLLTRSEQSS
jgi:hypothetical protein